MTLVWTTDSSIAYEKEVPAVPVYAPFVAGGFFFAPALFLHEVNRPPRSELFTVDLCLHWLSDPANQATFLGSLRPAPALDIHGRGDLHVCPAVDVRLRHILAHCQRAQPLLRTQTLSQVLGVRQQVGKTNIIHVPYRIWKPNPTICLIAVDSSSGLFTMTSCSWSSTESRICWAIPRPGRRCFILTPYCIGNWIGMLPQC